MLTIVDVFGVQAGAQLSLPIAGAEDEPIQIKDIAGLDPVKAAVATSSYGVIPGEAISGTSIPSRNIVLTLGLNPDWDTQTIEELRKLLYRYFMPQLSVTLRFTSTHLPVCQIVGVVESMTPSIFSADPEIQVSIICGRPEFISVEQTTLSGFVATDLESMTELDYVGSAVTGMVLLVQYSASRITYTGSLNVHLENVDTTNLTLTEVTVDASHQVELSSVPGDKYVRSPGSPPTNLLIQIQSGYGWPILKPGLNKFAVVGELDGQRWTMSYLTKFGGL